MGYAKREMERHDEMVAAATVASLRAKALKRCIRHEDVFLDAGDPDACNLAYAIGTNMVKAGEVRGTREEFMEVIKEVLNNAGDECGWCARDAERD